MVYFDHTFVYRLHRRVVVVVVVVFIVCRKNVERYAEDGKREPFRPEEESGRRRTRRPTRRS